MKNIKKDSCPTDLSAVAGNAIGFAVRIGEVCGAEVIVYHVIAYEDDELRVHHGAEQWVAAAENSEEIQELMRKRKLDLERYLRFAHAL